jgi:peptidoglycan hydrolase CwlO-like protein
MSVTETDNVIAQLRSELAKAQGTIQHLEARISEMNRNHALDDHGF